MTAYRFFVPLFACAAYLSAGAAAQPASPPASPPAAQFYCGTGYGNGVMGFLTPEQRFMHFAEVREATETMSFDGARDYRLGLRTKVMAMSPAERKHFADDLSTKWQGLSAEKKDKIQQEFANYRGYGRWGAAGGRGMGRGMGPGQGMGMGRGRGGCWW